MNTQTTTFPECYTAVAIAPTTSLEEALKRLSHDVAAIVEDGAVIGTVTASRIVTTLKRGELSPMTPVESIMEPWKELGSGSSLESQLHDVFSVFVFSVIRRQTEVKVFNPSRRDGVLTILFEHIRKQLINGKYESCIRRMAFGHWLRTVVNNRIIDELRKIPSPEAVEEFRTAQRARRHASNPNPVRELNQTDVMVIIDEAVAELPAKQRLAVLQNIKHPDMSGDESAETLGMTLNAFHLNLNRARDKIQKCLKELAPDTVSIVRTLRNRPRNVS
jgi:RNA polymerase sigma factor (sigma-70 family)